MDSEVVIALWYICVSHGEVVTPAYCAQYSGDEGPLPGPESDEGIGAGRYDERRGGSGRRLGGGADG